MAFKRRIAFCLRTFGFGAICFAVTALSYVRAADNVEARAALDQGVRLIQSGRSSEAAGYLQHAAELDPTNWYVQSNLAFALDQTGRKREAFKHYEKAYEIDPAMLSSTMGLASTYAYFKDFPTGIKICLRYLATNRAKREDAFAAYKMLGWLYASNKQPQKAYASYQQALALHSDEGAWKEAVQTIISTGSAAETETIIKEFLKRFPRSSSRKQFSERLSYASFDLERKRTRQIAVEKAKESARGDELDSFIIFANGNRNTVSEETIALVKEGLHSIPKLFVDQLRNAGYRVMIAPYLTDILPELARQHPRGHEQLATWHNCNGTFDADHKWIVLGEKYTNILTGKEVVDLDIDRTVAHEFGHAYDCFLGNSSLAGRDKSESYTNFSHSERFLKAYEVDSARVKDKTLREKLNYFLQPGDAGREELFAQLFPAFYGGIFAPNSPEALFSSCFPTLLADMKKALSTDLEYEKLYGRKVKNYR